MSIDFLKLLNLRIYINTLANQGSRRRRGSYIILAFRLKVSTLIFGGDFDINKESYEVRDK